MSSETVLVLDCGSTNITAVAVDATGKLGASFSEPNGPVAQAGAGAEWRVWDLDKLWATLSALIARVCAEVGAGSVKAVTITTWGADGAPVMGDGTLAYPPIAWECPRLVPVAAEVGERIGARRLYDVTGYQVISFNTLFKLVWLRENEPDALDRAATWMQMPGLLSHKLCGEFSMDATSASTMMLLDLDKAGWSAELLGEAGVDPAFMPPLVYPGAVIGEVTAEAAKQTGLAAGIPVVAAGHDTQFAPIGSGAGKDEAVLSSGTWEILMLRTPKFAPDETGFSEGLITELDAIKGLYNPQLLMMGSGVLEWVRENMYSETADRGEAYKTMIEEAGKLKPGCDGVTMVPSFVPDTGPTKKYGTRGTLVGLGLATTRAHVYRAALEGLACQLRDALRILKAATGFEPKGIRAVGGGSRNQLWNQIRADVCNMPVSVTAHKEATVLGAAIAAWTGAGRFASVEDGQNALVTESEVVEPSGEAGAYAEVFERYCELPPALKDFYTS